MKPCALLLIFCLPVFSQILTGTVQKIEKDQLQVKGREGSVTFRANENTIVAKLKKANSLSLLAVGDNVRVTYYGEGALTAVNISAKITVSGIIAQAATNHLTISSEDPAAADRKTNVFVFLNPTTKLGVTRDQLRVGRKIQVTGWDSGDGVLEADKVVVN